MKMGLISQNWETLWGLIQAPGASEALNKWMWAPVLSEVIQISHQEGTLLSAVGNRKTLTQLAGKRKFISPNKRCRGRWLRICLFAGSKCHQGHRLPPWPSLVLQAWSLPCFRDSRMITTVPSRPRTSGKEGALLGRQGLSWANYIPSLNFTCLRVSDGIEILFSESLLSSSIAPLS